MPHWKTLPALFTAYSGALLAQTGATATLLGTMTVSATADRPLRYSRASGWFPVERKEGRRRDHRPARAHRLPACGWRDARNCDHHGRGSHPEDRRFVDAAGDHAAGDCGSSAMLLLTINMSRTKSDVLQ